MAFDARLAEAWSRLPDYLGSHVLVSLTALAIGLGISLPVAVASRHRPLLRGGLLAIASVVQTIPGLALLALFYPLLLALSAPVRAHLRQGIFGARLPAGGACIGALFDAAGPAQHRDRPQRGRCPPERGRPRGRRAALAAAARYRAAAGIPGDHGRHPHVRSLGDRHGDTRNTDRPNQSRQLHFHRFADAELGFRDFRLRRGRPARFGGRSVACAGAGRRHPPQ